MANLGTTNYEIDIGLNVTEITFFMPSRVLQSSEKYLISFISMASEIGGYVGLLLGVSFFHFATFISNVIEKRKVSPTKDKLSVFKTPPPKLSEVAPVS